MKVHQSNISLMVLEKKLERLTAALFKLLTSSILFYSVPLLILLHFLFLLLFLVPSSALVCEQVSTIGEKNCCLGCCQICIGLCANISIILKHWASSGLLSLLTQGLELFQSTVVGFQSASKRNSRRMDWLSYNQLRQRFSRRDVLHPLQQADLVQKSY